MSSSPSTHIITSDMSQIVSLQKSRNFFIHLNFSDFERQHSVSNLLRHLLSADDVQSHRRPSPRYFQNAASFSRLSCVSHQLFTAPDLDVSDHLLHPSQVSLLRPYVPDRKLSRPVMNINSTAFLFSGPCKIIHKDVCFVCFDVFQVRNSFFPTSEDFIFQLVFDASAFAVPVTLYYKYRKVTSINNKDLSRFKVKLILLSSYLLSIVVGV